MTVLLKSMEQYFASTLGEAEKLQEELKESFKAYDILRSSIDRKTKKEEEYFIVSITVGYNIIGDLI